MGHCKVSPQSWIIDARDKPKPSIQPKMTWTQGRLCHKSNKSQRETENELLICSRACVGAHDK